MYVFEKLDKVIKFLIESELFDGGGDQGAEQSGESDWNSEEEEEDDGVEYNITFLLSEMVRQLEYMGKLRRHSTCTVFGFVHIPQRDSTK